MKTFRTKGKRRGKKNREKKKKKKHSGAENSLGWLHCSAHGLFILRISAGDLRAGLCVGCRLAGWLAGKGL